MDGSGTVERRGRRADVELIADALGNRLQLLLFLLVVGSEQLKGFL